MSKRIRPADYPEKHRLVDLAWRTANPERQSARNAAWMLANRDRARIVDAQWAAANKDRKRDARQRRIALTKGAKVERIVSRDVFVRDGWKCYICGVICLPDAPMSDRLAAELDHVEPISKGGSHTMDNVKCACHPCNRIKRARGTEQAEAMRLWFNESGLPSGSMPARYLSRYSEQ